MRSVPLPTGGPFVPADLGEEAAEEWLADGSTAATALDQPAETTTRSLLLEIRRHTAAVAATNRAIAQQTVVTAVLLLGILGALVAIAAALWQ